MATSLAVAAGCTGAEADEADEADERQPTRRIDDQGRVVLTRDERAALQLDVAVARSGTLTTSSLRFGRVVARPGEDAPVVAPMMGRLLSLAATLGASISKGDALATIEPLVEGAARASLESERRQLLGQIVAARARIEAKRADLERVRTLASSGLATEVDRVQVEAAVRSEQAVVESLERASAELGRVAGGRLTLRAPAAGVVATLASDVGSLVQQGGVLARIVRAGPRWVDVAVPPDDPVGRGYRIANRAAELPACLLSRGSVIQSDGTRRDRLEADSEASLLPGATVAVRVLHEARGIVVPESAVVRRGPETLAFVEVEDGHYDARRVEVSARDGGRAVVTRGLSPGDRVVTRGAASLLGELGNASGTAADTWE